LCKEEDIVKSERKKKERFKMKIGSVLDEAAGRKLAKHEQLTES
jgi:hypothetical protein